MIARPAKALAVKVSPRNNQPRNPALTGCNRVTREMFMAPDVETIRKNRI